MDYEHIVRFQTIVHGPIVINPFEVVVSPGAVDLGGVALTLGEGTTVPGDAISYTVSYDDPGRPIPRLPALRRYPGRGNRRGRRAAAKGVPRG